MLTPLIAEAKPNLSQYIELLVVKSIHQDHKEIMAMQD